MLRVYVDIVKQDGENRYKQLVQLASEKYKNLVDECTRKTYGKYEALEKGKAGVSCKEYETYVIFKQDSVKVFIARGKQAANSHISIIHLHEEMYNADRARN